MTRLGLSAIHPATPTLREAKTFMPTTVVAEGRRLEPECMRPSSARMWVNCEPRAVRTSRAIGRHPSTKPHRNPKSP